MNQQQPGVICLDRPYKPEAAVSKSMYRVRQKLYAVIDACIKKKSVLPEVEALMQSVDRHERILNRVIERSPEVFSG